MNAYKVDAVVTRKWAGDLEWVAVAPGFISGGDCFG
jgi:hypothetical protein